MRQADPPYADPALRDAPPAGDAHCDVLVVGGGIHGVSVARDLAGRGWSVILCEQHDLAQHGSSASSKLLHGGLVELAQGQLGRVRRALAEREGLLQGAPHITAPLSMVMPYGPGLPSPWAARLVLWLYDHLAPRDWLPESERMALVGHPMGEALKSVWQEAFVYADGLVDDARLVLMCALAARDKGARILTRTACVDLRPVPQGWQALLAHHDAHTGKLSHRSQVQARLVVNAAGPWVPQVQAQIQAHAPAHSPAKAPAQPAAVWFQRSHVVVPRLFAHEHGHVLHGDGHRLVFVLPFEQHFSLIAAADGSPLLDALPDAPPGPCARVSDAEVDALCQTVNRYFKRSISREDVVWRFAEVWAEPEGSFSKGRASARLRPVVAQGGPSPWVTLWGGPLTAFRRVAEEASALACECLGEPREAWTRHASLPGGRLLDLIDREEDPATDLAEFQRRLRKAHPWMDVPLARRWSRQYGALVLEMLKGVHARADLGPEVAPGLFEWELQHLCREEWAATADDVLWRRTRLGLHYDDAQRAAVSAWFSQRALVDL
jgi:glycerol-3-phosphate dehydrogenase